MLFVPGPKLTEEEIETIEKEKKRLLPRVLECFKSESYVDGLNDACSVFRLVSLSGRYYVEVAKRLTVETVEWFHDEIIPNAGKDKEMRINQAIIFCFLLYLHEKVFWDTIFNNIFPFFVDSSLPTDQILFSLGKKMYDLSKSKEVKNREIYFSAERHFNFAICTLNEGFPGSGLSAYCCPYY